MDRARTLGAPALITRLKALQAKFPPIGEVRGLGLDGGDRTGQEPARRSARCRADARAGAGGARHADWSSCRAASYANVIRFLAPLTIEDVAARRKGWSLLEAAFADVAGAPMAATG